MAVNFNYAGIDLSLSSTGIVIFNSSGDIVETYVKSAGSEKLYKHSEERYHTFIESIKNILIRHEVAVVFVEGYSFASVFQSHQLFEIGALLRDACYVMDVPIIKIPPTTVKKFVTGKGNSKKDVMRLGVYKKWKVEFETNDEVDAYAIARVGEGLLFSEKLKTVSEREVITTILRSIPKYYLTALEDLGISLPKTLPESVKKKK